MTMYANLETLEIIDRMQLQALFPNTSFPPEIVNPNINEFGWTILEFDPEPELTTLQQLDWGVARREGERVIMSWVVINPTNDQWLEYNTNKLTNLQRQANAQITALQGRVDTIQDAIDLEEVLDSELQELPYRKSQLKAWKSYRIELGRVANQAGWPPNVIWPTTPEPYTNEMSLTVNAPQNS